MFPLNFLTRSDNGMDVETEDKWQDNENTRLRKKQKGDESFLKLDIMILVFPMLEPQTFKICSTVSKAWKELAKEAFIVKLNAKNIDWLPMLGDPFFKTSVQTYGTALKCLQIENKLGLLDYAPYYPNLCNLTIRSEEDLPDECFEKIAQITSLEELYMGSLATYNKHSSKSTFALSQCTTLSNLLSLSLEVDDSLSDHQLVLLTPYTKLQTLKLYASITGSGWRHLSHLTNLQNLEIYTSAPVQDLSNLPALNLLEIFNFQSSCCTKSQLEINLTQLTCLKELTLPSLCVSSESQLSPHPNLQFLKWMCNDYNLKNIAMCSNLRVVDLSYSAITGSCFLEMSDLPSLTELHLKECYKLKYANLRLLENNHLKVLSLNRKTLNQFDVLWIADSINNTSFANLKILDVSKNVSNTFVPFYSLQKGFSKLTHLEIRLTPEISYRVK